MRAPPLTPLAAAVLHVPPPERALVVECGDGAEVFLLAREFPAARIRGVDASADRLQAVRDRLGLDPEGRVAFKLGRPGELAYPDGFFDLVVQSSGRRSPLELARVLRPGGHLILIRHSPPRLAKRLRERLEAARLERRGLLPVLARRAGDGGFLVVRLSA